MCDKKLRIIHQKDSKARCGEPSSTKVSKIKKLRWGNSNEKMQEQ